MSLMDDWSKLGESNPGFGKCVSIAGSIVAAISSHHGAFSVGRRDKENVAVHRFNEGKWIKHGTVRVPNGRAVDLELSEDGKCLVIGMYGLRGAGESRSYLASFLVYDFVDNDWKQLGTEHFLPDNATPSYEAESNGGVVAAPVSISADCRTVAIGAPNTHANGEVYAGLVRVYDLRDDDWSQCGQDMIGSKAKDNFGIDVSLSADGNRMAVGAYQSTHDFRYSGYAQVYEWNEGSWIQMGQTFVGNEAGDLFGIAVSLSDDGSTVAVGAPYSNVEGTCGQAGQIRVYRYEETSSRWTSLGQVLNGRYPGDDFGRSLELSADGNSLCAASTRHSFHNDKLHNTQHVRVYRLDAGGEWKLMIEKNEVDAQSWDSSCSISPEGMNVAHGGNDIQVFELDVVQLEER